MVNDVTRTNGVYRITDKDSGAADSRLSSLILHPYHGCLPGNNFGSKPISIECVQAKKLGPIPPTVLPTHHICLGVGLVQSLRDLSH